MSQPSVCVAVSTYNRSGRLPALIAALEAQTLPPDDFEVVIADNGSADDTADVLRTLQAQTSVQLRVVTVDVNRGPGRGRNAAWRAAEAPIVAFTDDDCIPSPRWLEAALARFDDRVGIVVGRTLPDPAYAGGDTWTASHRSDFLNRSYDTSNVLYRREHLEKVGGFDESIGFFGEDTSLGWAVRAAGAEDRYAPEAVVFHAVTPVDVDWHVRRARLFGKVPAVVSRYPQMREEFLVLRMFLSWREVRFVAALAGVAAGAAWRPALALTIPYLLELRRVGARRIPGRVRVDLTRVAATARGSVRARTVVL